MSTRPERFPDELPTDLTGLPRLVSLLTRDFLDDLDVPFVRPDPLLDMVAALRFWRLPGAGRRADRVARTLPATLLAGAVALRAPFCFRLQVHEGEVEVAVGSTPEQADALARATNAALGGPVPRPATGGLLNAPSFLGCLAGTPMPATPTGFGGPDSSPLDLVLDAAWTGRLTYLVFATPEPHEEVRTALKRLRAAAQEVERGHLTGPHGEANRMARRARDLLDRLCRRLEGGAAWRTTALIGADDAAAGNIALALLVGALRADADQAVAPLRAAACGTRGRFATHQDVLAPAELAGLCPLPQRDRAGFALTLQAAFDVDHTSSDDGLALGRILDGDAGAGPPLTVPTATLCRHGLVAGMTGSGKSTTVRSLLLQLARRGLSFLVLEPAKAEYRGLSGAVRDLLVFRVGAAPRDDELPLQFNPFSFPDGFPLHTHIDFLKQAMVSSFGLYPPAPYLLETAIYRCYERRGWNLGTGVHPHGRQRLAFPTLSDLLGQIDPVVEAAGYDREITRNLKGALRTRIGNLCVGAKGAMLDTRENLPDAVLFGVPTVLELKDLGSDEEKALVMGLVLTRLYEVRECGGVLPGEELRHLLVIEEAHRLLRRTVERSSEEGNMQGQAVQAFVNMLAEVRAYGEGVLVVEQLPGKLAPDVIKNTSLKVLHRTAPRDDRDAVGDTMNLDDEQKRYLAVLRQGEAVVHFEGMDGAVRARVARATVPPHAEAVELAARTRARLPEADRPRFARAVTRSRLSQHLRDAVVRHAGERAVLATLCDGDAKAARRCLAAELERRMTVGTAMPSPAAVAAAATLAIDDALERVALHHELRDEALESLRAHSAADGAAEELRSLLARPLGPRTFCEACPARCHFGYFGREMGQDRHVLDRLADCLRERGADWPAQISELVHDASERVYGWTNPLPAALTGCIAGHALEQLGLRAASVDALTRMVLDANTGGDERARTR